MEKVENNNTMNEDEKMGDKEDEWVEVMKELEKQER